MYGVALFVIALNSGAESNTLLLTVCPVLTAFASVLASVQITAAILVAALLSSIPKLSFNQFLASLLKAL